MALLNENYLTQLLETHWLRPETALWRTFDCLLLEDNVKLDNKIVDLGCGDGTFSFIAAGGKLINFDVFKNVTSMENYNKGSDIHNIKVTDKFLFDDTNLRYSITYGIDNKDGLISKAKSLGRFYSDTKIHDLNEKLPDISDDFDFAFSNILYWLNDLNSILTDWNRILNKDGQLILFVPNNNFKEKAWFYYKAPHSGYKKYFNYFDRNYASLIHHCYSYKTWKDIFNKAGFKIKMHKPYLSDIVMEIWNIGTRPISPLLINTANKLNDKDREEVKKDWVNYFKDFFLPIVHDEYSRTISDKESAFHFFVLEKNQ